ncbi:DUF982 domain-containing protein [Mesorhizobium amorphae]|uniref:DUF982 domain-containing protein n=1 Tax=Mesorhizobium amorphae TaxID=71433 RepID=UPI003F502772
MALNWNRAACVCIAALAGEATPQEARTCFKMAAVDDGRLLPRNEEDEWVM